MANRGTKGVSAKFFAKKIVENYKEAIASFDPELLEGLTGMRLVQLGELKNRPDSIRMVEQSIDSTLKSMRDDGLIDGDGLTDSALDVIAFDLVDDELRVLGKLGYGEHRAHEKGGSVFPIEPKPFEKGMSYRSISPRKSVAKAVRRGHSSVEACDLVAWEKGKNTSVDFVFALDSSGSMRGKKIDACKRAAIGLAFVSLHEGDRTSVLSFNKKSHRVVSFGESLFSFSKNVASLAPTGTTDLGLGLREARNLLLSSGLKNRKHIILITDGIPTEGKKPLEAALEEAYACKEAEVSVSVIGIGVDKDGEKNGRAIALIGEGQFYQVADVEKINEAVLSDRKKSKV